MNIDVGKGAPYSRPTVNRDHPLGNLWLCPTLNGDLWDAATEDMWDAFEMNSGVGEASPGRGGQLWLPAVDTPGGIAYTGQPGDLVLQCGQEFPSIERRYGDLRGPASGLWSADFLAYSYCFLFSPDNGNAGTKRLGDSDIGQPAGLAVNQTAGNYLNAGPIKQAGTANTGVQTPFTNGDWIMYHDCRGENDGVTYHNAVQSQTFSDLSVQKSIRGSGLVAHLKVWSINSTVVGGGVGSTRGTEFQGKLGGFWFWPYKLSAAEVTAHVAAPWGMLQETRERRYWLFGATGVTAALTGLANSIAIGTLGVNEGLSLTGQAAQTQQGSLAGSESVPVAGQAASVQIGAVSPAIVQQLSGVSASVAGGSLGVSSLHGLTGQQLLVLAGVIGTAGDVTAALLGIALSAQIGAIQPASGVTLSGLAAPIAQGALSQSASIGIVGLQMVTRIGNVSVPTVGNVVFLRGSRRELQPKGKRTH